ncbi:unnamed protein product [Lepeophtheirus salmonis]|uniref:(salmon louse) hypothetical protein n=1 Tax=Lepeophtheirus salmonis TaxID=72036 RepID=A0A7R8GZ58_LEPSM|nr:unnamed protein product [Lepeophtheirus salmonis]CAF2757983.1 unnamed protein product [Lepeophtheirus salmonis]
MLTTSVGYHSEHLKMDPDGMALGGGNTHPDPFSGGSPPFTGGNEEEFEPVQLPPGALSEEQQAAVQQSHSALHSLHHPGASVASSHYPPHYSHLSAQLYHQQHSHHSHPHPHHSHHPQQPPPPSQWNPYGMNGYVGTGATGGGYHPLHHAPPMDASSYYYSSASGPPPNAQPPPSAYHPSNPSGGGQQSMALPGGPSPAGSHNTPSPQAHSEDGDNSDPHLRNNNVLKRPAVDYSSSSPHVHSLMNPGSYHPPLPPAKKSQSSKRKKKRDPNEPQKTSERLCTLL